MKLWDSIRRFFNPGVDEKVVHKAIKGYGLPDGWSYSKMNSILHPDVKGWREVSGITAINDLYGDTVLIHFNHIGGMEYEYTLYRLKSGRYENGKRKA